MISSWRNMWLWACELHSDVLPSLSICLFSLCHGMLCLLCVMWCLFCATLGQAHDLSCVWVLYCLFYLEVCYSMILCCGVSCVTWCAIFVQETIKYVPSMSQHKTTIYLNLWGLGNKNVSIETYVCSDMQLMFQRFWLHCSTHLEKIFPAVYTVTSLWWEISNHIFLPISHCVNCWADMQTKQSLARAL